MSQAKLSQPKNNLNTHQDQKGHNHDDNDDDRSFSFQTHNNNNNANIGSSYQNFNIESQLQGSQVRPSGISAQIAASLIHDKEHASQLTQTKHKQLHNQDLL